MLYEVITNPFKVPDHYFDKFEDELFRKTFVKHTVGKGAYSRALRPLLYLAAAFALFVLVDKIILHNTASEPAVAENIKMQPDADMLYSTLDEYQVLGLCLDDESLTTNN